MVYQTEKWGKATELVLTEEAIDDTYSWLKVKVLDKNGILCLDARNVVEFFAIGDAELIKHQGTPHGSQKVQLCNGEAKIKVKHSGDNYSLTVKSDGVESAVVLGKNNN